MLFAETNRSTDMNFYRLRMTWTTEGGENTLPPDKLEEFIIATKFIGIGCPTTGGYKRFTQDFRKGDLVTVLAQNSKPFVLVKILDDAAQDYVPLEDFPLLDWVEKVHQVEIISWYKNIQNVIPAIEDNRSWGPNTCAIIDVTETRKFTQDWYNKVMGAKISIDSPLIAEKTNLLSNVKNLILTGAPGTGKTYLAKKIAYKLTGATEENSPKIAFCQFHPSYDYTDFVEGLRPTPPNDEDSNIGFKRQDGVFMAFCRNVMEKQIIYFNEVFDKFLQDLNENGSRLELETSAQRRKFKVFPNSEQNLKLFTGPDERDSGSLTRDRFIKTLILNDVVNDYWSYYYDGVTDYLKEKYRLNFYSQQYVFIIDEINRGDIAKIFGELFFSIDPGYRGIKGKVKTQYANLNQTDRFFKDGFYVPKNVYIIGTMNDIDRNVESMDFAIRRRFTWVEITPDQTVDMLYERENGILEYAEKAEKCMYAINEQIKQIEELGLAYQLGAAYFLKLNDYSGDFKQRFDLLWKYNIRPLLKEYLRGVPMEEEKLSKLDSVFWASLGIQGKTGTDENNSATEQQ